MSLCWYLWRSCYPSKTTFPLAPLGLLYRMVTSVHFKSISCYRKMLWHGIQPSLIIHCWTVLLRTCPMLALATMRNKINIYSPMVHTDWYSNSAWLNIDIIIWCFKLFHFLTFRLNDSSIYSHIWTRCHFDPLTPLYSNENNYVLQSCPVLVLLQLPIRLGLQNDKPLIHQL